VLAGGLIGSVGRYLVQQVADQGRFPWGTLGVNVAGAFLLGYLASRLANKPDSEIKLAFLAVGFIGAFTTFSALVAQIWTGPLVIAITYGSLSVIAGLGATVLGSRWGRTQT
jgi:CrcB protein